MLAYVSERRLSEQIRQLENIQDQSADEIAIRMDQYSKKLFQYLYKDYGIRFTAIPEQNGTTAVIDLDISGVGRNWQTSDFDWTKLQSGLALINPIAVTITQADIQNMCDGFIGQLAVKAFPRYADELTRISVSEIAPKVENALLQYVHKEGWESPIQESSPVADAINAEFHEAGFQETLSNAGLKDPLAPYRKVEERRQAELDAAKAAEDARLERIMNGEF